MKNLLKRIYFGGIGMLSKRSLSCASYNCAFVKRIFIKKKYNSNQFEIIDSNSIRLNENVPFKSHGLIKDKDGSVNGINKYVRIVIKRKPEQFEIVGIDRVLVQEITGKVSRFLINGKEKYARIVIKRK